MMNTLRGQVAKMIFGVLLLAFLAWIVLELGMQGRVGSGAGAVAVVNGEKVLSQEFWMIYNQELEGNWASLRSTMTEADEKELRRQVLDRLVNQTVIWQEAKRLKVGVSPQEVETAIHSLPAFVNPQTGQFDPYRYQAALSRLGVPVQLFEMEQERAMSAGRLESFMREAVRVTDLELWLEYLRWHRVMKASVLRFPLTEAKANVVVTADEVKNYWDQNRREFEKAERVRIRHIVVAANPQAGPEAQAQARGKMESIGEELRKGADFADVARRKSDDANTAPRGGDLGWRVKGELIPEYDSVVFTLRKGQLSKVFQTKFGYHLIRCEDHQYEEKPTFEQVREKIRDKIVTARAKEKLAAEAARAGFVAKREKDVAKVAQVVGRRAFASGWFEWGKTAPAGLSKKETDELVKALAAVEAGEITEVVDTGEGYVMAQLLEERHQRAPEAGFLKERAVIEPVFQARKQRASYDAWLAGLKERARIKLTLEGA